jgi:fructose-1,6-bisphosphatase II
MDLVRVTEAAALSAAHYMGLGNKEAGDQAAVDAMRAVLSTIEMDGVVVIGEGEKDEAPMLFNGEMVGTGRPPAVDVAVDPVEGTGLLALGRPNAISVIALAERWSMWQPGPSLYMSKIVVEQAAKQAIDITLSPTENLHRIAGALGRQVNELTVFILDKPRHEALIAEVRQTSSDRCAAWSRWSPAFSKCDLCCSRSPISPRP